MKCLIFSFIILFSSLIKLSAKTSNYEQFTYNIKAEIEGLSKGDTICFENVNFPWLNLNSAFKVIIVEDGEFSYEGSAFRSQYFLMTYKPLLGKKVVSDKDGLYVYIDDSGDILIKGSAENIYDCRIEGGVYDNKESSHALNIMAALKKIIYAPLEELEASYSALDEAARKSHYGIILRQEIDNIAMLAPGNDAPFFILNTMDGQQVTSDDYSGYYVLIYKFGLSEGSLMIDKDVTAFFENNKERVKVIGLTDDINTIRQFYERVSSSEKALKALLESMLSHPWIDVEQTGDNVQLTMDYIIAGHPFFIFISPEGKMLARGFHDAFYKAQEILKENIE